MAATVNSHRVPGRKRGNVAAALGYRFNERFSAVAGYRALGKASVNGTLVWHCGAKSALELQIRGRSDQLIAARMAAGQT
ncbi:hypothetical protein [Mesorhizobium amorphae]|uniref:Uncharacterized protein n=1 Tax=Mesorhizobium amorphae CCNWGS0123 TaxID=1082933 RepID=G6YE78_9HYPH|nr:hypothetical protein [Mesorhizobium amorphae]ANT50208.1 hypothetical protein A6B35_09860 [Mesorhizobium amorphae CCNWGS0123]EHH10019.1 hypothetical protein MEA186_21354 [Mesorhizobium amorphae CCNWGS0123]GLR39590.1 hypothetical protein GCM10007880_01060 [Mesorhizobium amorphae]